MTDLSQKCEKVLFFINIHTLIWQLFVCFISDWKCININLRNRNVCLIFP